MATGTGAVVGVLRERSCGEARVALLPEALRRVQDLGCRVLVEDGAGLAAGSSTEDYLSGGAEVLPLDRLLEAADVLCCVRLPGPEVLTRLRVGQVLLGLLAPALTPDVLGGLAQAKVTAVSFQGLPRTLSRAQGMDALTSQSNIAGYKAALLAADTSASLFPMLTTAAGTSRPARVLVLGAGVAGLQAIATSRRLGAVVTGFDVRASAHAEVRSVGATLLELGLPPAVTGDDGYARDLPETEQGRLQAALADAVAPYDVVITTAQVPGRPPPLLLNATAVGRLARGAVVVDLAAGPLGGNVEGVVPDRTTVTDGGVTLVGAGELAARVPHAASVAYGRNVAALLAHLLQDGALRIDLGDEVQAGVVRTHDGVVRP